MPGHAYPQPEDYVKDYSPLGRAELVMVTSDRHPPSKLLGVLRMVKHRLAGGETANDFAARRMLAAITSSYGTVNAETIQRGLSKALAGDHLRKLEYAFYAKCLARDDVRKIVIVDFGGGASLSTTVPMLFQLPDAQIYSVDISHLPEISRNGVRYVRRDLRETRLPAAWADVVSLISTVEHVGLGRYGDPPDVDGDLHSIEEAFRILKPGGHVVLTIPYGFPTVVFNLHRVYDEGRFARVCRFFEVVIHEYSKLGRSCLREEIEGERPVLGLPGLGGRAKAYPEALGGAMALLRKPRGFLPPG
jgi:SAM-dependent methyltransferase